MLSKVNGATMWLCTKKNNIKQYLGSCDGLRDVLLNLILFPLIMYNPISDVV